MRQHARRAAAGGTLVALLIAIWWFASQRRGSAPQQAVAPAASLPTQYNDAPFTAPLRIQRTPRIAAGGELCGYGPLPVVDGETQIPPDLVTRAASARHRLAAELAAGTTDRDRALGMYLQMAEARDAAIRGWIRAHGDCAQDEPACQSDIDQAVAADTSAYRNALVRLATATSDAEAYALAMYSCGSGTSQPLTGDCALLSYAQWARLEPDNAVPWVYLAGEAQRRHDRSGLETSLNRASKSRYSDLHWDAIPRFLASETYGAEPSPIQVQLAIPLLMIQAAAPLPNFQVSTQYCSPAATSASSGDACRDLAALLIEHGRTVIEVMIGDAMAERVKWTDPRFSALRDQVDAVRWQTSQAANAAPEDLVLGSCGSLQLFRRRMAIQAQFGEAGFLRQELSESGLSTSQAAERWRAEAGKRAIEQASTSEAIK